MMRTGKSLKGISVIDILTGKSLGQVNDLLIDLKEMSLYGILVVKGRLFEKQRVIPFRHLLGVGRDAMMLEDREKEQDDEVEYRRLSHFKGHRMITVSGDYFGELVDLFVDLSTGKIEEYLFYPVDSPDETLFTLSAQSIHLLGEDIIIVSRESPEKVQPFSQEKVQKKASPLPLFNDIKDELGELQEKIQNIKVGSLKRLTGMGKGEEVAEEILVAGEEFLGRILKRSLLDDRGEVLVQKGTPLTRDLIKKIIQGNRLPELLKSIKN